MSKTAITNNDAWAAEPAAGAIYEPSTGERIKAFITGPWPTLLSRFVLGGIFLLAGLTKLGVPETMAESIRAYEIPLPSALVDIMAVGLPILEVGLGIWLILGLFTRLAAGISIGLLAIFTIAITQAWLRGLNIDCGCFAGAEANSIGLGIMRALGPVGTFLANERSDLPTIIREVVLLLMGVHLLLVPTILSIDSLRNRHNEEEILEEEVA
jgi:putative oxidoreductase